MSGVEETRARFRPVQVSTLFVGESAPASGDFFYFGNTVMTQHMRRAIEETFGPTDDFLQTFKSYGWFLDDLVLLPLNKMPPIERKLVCKNARPDLADRIRQYQPKAIVTLLRSIAVDVEAAARMAGSAATRYVVPFPGFGQQRRFHVEMTAILPLLPKVT